MLITSSWIVDMLVLFLLIIFLLYKYSTSKHDYWKKKGVHFIKPIPFFGNVLELFTFQKNIGIWTKELYNKVDQSFFGIYVFNEPYFILKSPELIKRVMVTDFHFFTDRIASAPEHDEVIKNVMFLQKNPDWKNTRPLITKVFTSGKIKAMFPIINNIGQDMNRFIHKNLGSIETKELCAKYATDVIAKCAFAIYPNSFNNKDPDFRKAGRALFDFRWRNAIIQTMYIFLPDWADLLHLKFFEQAAMQYLTDAFWKALELREKENLKGNDLIDTIIEVRKNTQLCNDLKFEGGKVAAQAMTFFIAGFETTSSVIAFTLYELCLHPEIQDKLRDEIVNNIQEHNGITYESVQKMEYLDRCVLEALRKYPVLSFLDRRCNTDYKVPGTDITIEKGTPIIIPVWGLQLDEKYFPDPDEYKPDRFCNKTSHNVNGLYYLPFGKGPRSCLGERFAMLSTKLGLIHILSEFIVERTSETPVPLKLSAKSFIVQAESGISMKFKRCQTSK